MGIGEVLGACLPARQQPCKGQEQQGRIILTEWLRGIRTLADAAAKRDTEQGIVRHISHFMGAGTAGYLGNVSEKNRAESLDYDDLVATTLLHGSPATVIAKLRELRHQLATAS